MLYVNVFKRRNNKYINNKLSRFHKFCFIALVDYFSFGFDVILHLCGIAKYAEETNDDDNNGVVANKEN